MKDILSDFGSQKRESGRFPTASPSEIRNKSETHIDEALVIYTRTFPSFLRLFFFFGTLLGIDRMIDATSVRQLGYSKF